MSYIEGVSIVYEVALGNSLLGVLIILFSTIAFLFSIGTMVAFNEEDHDRLSVISLIIGVVIFLTGFAHGLSEFYKGKGYVAQIDESVSLTEFYENYEIVDQNEYGFIIKEKKEKNK